MRTVVIGAGLGGLTTAALLLQAGHQVTLLEAHVYPGGCAGTFYHKGYRFDAGATLSGGFAPGGPHTRLAELLDLTWPIQPVDPAWVVHLPGLRVTQHVDRAAWHAEAGRAFPGTQKFWRMQETLADIAWDISSRPFPWPPESAADWATLTLALRPRTVLAAPFLFRTLADLRPAGNLLFATFLDAQLLISAQTIARHATALYASAALDLPRRGVNHVRGGIGALAQTLARWFTQHGGDLRYRQTVERIETRNGRAVAVHTDKGLRVECDSLVANLTPWALAKLLGEATPPTLLHETRTRPATWGAFTLYLGLDSTMLPAGLPDHHQVVVDPAQPLGEGNSVFISLSESTDETRAPRGQRVATLSTHTRVAPWFEALHTSAELYQARKADYTERLLAAAETALPGLRRAVRFILPGTPASFEYFTGRPQGMVGGFAQTSLFAARGPHTGLANAWLVGDSIFPGQSTAGVTLGAMRVAAAVARSTPRAIRLTKNFGEALAPGQRAAR